MNTVFIRAFGFWLRLMLIVYLLAQFTFETVARERNIIDSLNKVIATVSQDSAKVIALVELSKEYKKFSPDSAAFISLEAMRIAKEANIPSCIAAVYVSLGEIEVNRDDLDQSKTYYLEAIKYYQLIGADTKLPDLYLKLGSLDTFQDKQIQALTYFQKALEISEKHNLRLNMEQAYNNLGSVYKNLKKYDEALDCFNKALVISTELGLEKEVYYIYGNLGILHAMLGDKELAESYFKKTLEIALQRKDEVVEAFAYVSLGDFNMDIRNYPKALNYYQQALGKADVINTKYSGPKSLFFANVYSGIGSAHYFMKDYNQAIPYLLKGFDRARETGQLTIVAESADKLSHAYELHNQLNLALKYSRIYQATSDSVMNEDIVRRVTEMDMQNKFDKQMAEREFEQALNDATQKRNKVIYLMIIGGAVLGFVIFLLLFLLQKNKIKRDRLSTENLELEKEKLTKDLDFKNKELTTNVMYLLKKNELILNVSDKLKKAKMSFKVENRKVVEDVIVDLEAASKGDIWKEFELRFQEVHSDFYKKLNELFPNLTPNELKLCAFLRLNMSSKDIAAITFLSINGINIARHRLRKKLNIDQEENLIIFLSSL